MKAVKGIYERGLVRLLEPVVAEEREEVTILFPEKRRRAPQEVLDFAGMLSDLTAEETSAFDEALAHGLTFGRRIEL